MWRLSAYALYRIYRARGGKPVRFSELYRLFFDALWRCGIAFYEDGRELMNDILYMSRIGLVDISHSMDPEIRIRDHRFFDDIDREYMKYIHDGRLRERFPLISRAIEIINSEHPLN